MDQKWFISSIFGVFCFLNFSDFFLVASYTLSNSGSAYNDIDSNVWESHRDQFPVLQENFRNNFKEANGNVIEQPSGKDVDEKERWLNVLTFDKHCNLTEKDKGPQNETKNIFINTEEHIKIFENGDEEKEEDEDQLNSQLQEEEKNIFHLLSPEGFLSQIISQNQSKGLERTKRQAEDGRRRCRCRRIRRRGMSRRRRRRRRNRTGQQERRRRRGGRRRNRRRRGRRRCVCRKREDGEGKSDGDEPEVEEADGEEEGTTEEEDETTTGEEGKEKDSEEESDEEEDDEEDEEEEEEEEDEGEDDEGSSSASEGEMPSLNNIPTYLIPYPNMIETPIAMMPVGRVPIGSYSRKTTLLNTMPSYLAAGTLLPGNLNSKSEE